MEVIKELPEVFEEFAEQRKNSFLAVKQLKDQGIPVVGSYCTYFPQEIAMAMGAATVSLCSTSDETIAEAEKDLPKNLCPLIKSSYGFAKTDKCPFFYFSDVVVGETTCDGKKKMYELMSEFKDTFVMELPNSQSEDSLKLWKKEIIRFKEYLEKKFDVEITEEQIREAVKVNNEARRSLKKLYEVMRHDPAPISGYDLFKVLYGSTFKFDRKQIPGEVNALVDKIENDENVIAGFVVKNATDFEYVVNNSDMFDDMTQRFTYAMQLLSQYNYCKENNLDMAEIENAFNPVINSETTVLGKDMMSNYWYCYALIIIVFMVIILYGVMVATSVTQEKSNRTIELLVTSADTNSLFFGKVLAGTSAALLQVGIIFAVILGSYKINRDSWGGLFDKIFNIPSDVLITFAFFGLGGLLFYVFIYGAMGALVSKTEDINKSAGSVQFVIMIVVIMVIGPILAIKNAGSYEGSFIPADKLIQCDVCKSSTWKCEFCRDSCIVCYSYCKHNSSWNIRL